MTAMLYANSSKKTKKSSRVQIKQSFRTLLELETSFSVRKMQWARK